SVKNLYIGFGGNIVRRFYFGSNYLWRKTADDIKQDGWSFGLMAQPIKQVSIGWKYESTDWNSYNQFGIGLRPLNWRVTLFWEGLLPDEAELKDMSHFFGGELHLVDGIKLFGKVDQDNNFWAGAEIDFWNQGIGAVVQGNDEETSSETYYGHFSAEYFKTLIPKKDKYLYLSLSGTLEEQKRGFSFFEENISMTLLNLIITIDKAAKDEDIKGLVIRFNNFGLGMGMAEELRIALERFKAEGKKIYVYMDTPGNAIYYLASCADSIFMPESGSLNLTGLSAEMMFLKGTFDKLGIKADLEREGKYKSAVEMFTRDSMSAANREETEALLDDIYENLLVKIEEGRGWSEAKVRDLIDRGPYSATDALSEGLVDSLLYFDEFKKFVSEDIGLVGWNQYTSIGSREYVWGSKPKIAVVWAEGGIVRGSSGRSLLSGLTVGSETFAKAITAAKNDIDVKAILVRINSPGGSAHASDEMWHAVQQASEKKPVIVSIGNVAASGGYYLACSGDYIFADDNSITGSIGVISGKFSLGGLYDKIGVNKQIIKRGENSAIWTDSREFNEMERERVRRSVKNYYMIFKNRVVETREMSQDSVQSIAQGRVWTGKAGEKIGLVDSIGGLYDALTYTKIKGGLKIEDEIELKELPKPRFEFPFLPGFNAEVQLPDPLREELEKLPVFPYENSEPLYLWPYKLYIY
ncbi:signal peptide peptidase SppA, partial [bacterium]|nr:signal peptide peptidase SppA [bacterium]